MKLSELKEQVDKLSKAAKKLGVDPDVSVAVLPKFPMGLGLESRLSSSLLGDYPKEETGGVHKVYLGEGDRKEDYLRESIISVWGWDELKTGG